MAEDQELRRFLTDLNQEVRALAESSPDGALLEETATEYMIGMLTEAGETENARVCTDIKETRDRKIQHKISGYALSEDYETLDLFVTYYQDNPEFRTFPRAEIEKAANQSERFLKNAMNGYVNDIDEAAPIFELAHLLYKELKQIIRARIFILTNARLTGKDAVAERRVRETVVQYHLWDLERFHRLWSSTSKREPIEIDFREDFEEYRLPVACLPMPVDNEDYQSYLAILPGVLLANVYERYGARLLEQNVRSFLQFGGKINKGMRDTIRQHPHRFLAYNNGITATAEDVDLERLPDGGWGISRIRDLQIVNGGQTTASIFQTRRQDKADVSRVFVQMKLTVLRRAEEMEEIIPLIFKYANSQNNIQVADLSANHPFNIQLEKISRALWAPAPPGSTAQTRWFFERARGQYKVAIARELTPRNRKAFEVKNPRRQLFAKEMVAKFEHAWGLRPHLVARGAQKNYAEFIRERKKDALPGNVFFEDFIAKALLFQTADHEYGRGDNKIGDYKFLTVPYTLAWLNHSTKNRLDLYRIWLQQGVSDALREVLRQTLRHVDHFLQTTAGGKLVSEWAKKEDCWNLLMQRGLPTINLSSLQADYADPAQAAKRHQRSSDELAEEERRQQVEALTGLGEKGWQLIENWGRTSQVMSAHQLNRCSNIAAAISRRHALTDSEVGNGHTVLNLVLEHNPTLLDDFDPEATTIGNGQAGSVSDAPRPVTREDVVHLLQWEKQNRKFCNEDAGFLVKITKQEVRLTEPVKGKVRFMQNAATQRHGYQLPATTPVAAD